MSKKMGGKGKMAAGKADMAMGKGKAAMPMPMPGKKSPPMKAAAKMMKKMGKEV